MGCLVGSVAQFKNQNDVKHLPLELSADEVTLAVRQGWIELFPETSTPVRAAAAAAAAAEAAAAAAGERSNACAGGGDGRFGRRALPPDPDWEDAYHEYYSQFDPRVGFTGRRLPVLGPKRRRLAPPRALHPEQQQPQLQVGTIQQETQQPQHQAGGITERGGGQKEAQQAHQQKKEESESGTHATMPGAAAAAAAAAVVVASGAPDQSEAGWRAALGCGGSYTLPLTAAAATA
ncbi:hypothetical protein Agub_g5479, partial [Astrephomene gubernaculifera]